MGQVLNFMQIANSQRSRKLQNLCNRQRKPTFVGLHLVKQINKAIINPTMICCVCSLSQVTVTKQFFRLQQLYSCRVTSPGSQQTEKEDWPYSPKMCVSACVSLERVRSSSQPADVSTGQLQLVNSTTKTTLVQLVLDQNENMSVPFPACSC